MNFAARRSRRDARRRTERPGIALSRGKRCRWCRRTRFVAAGVTVDRQLRRWSQDPDVRWWCGGATSRESRRRGPGPLKKGSIANTNCTTWPRMPVFVAARGGQLVRWWRLELPKRVLAVAGRLSRNWRSRRARIVGDAEQLVYAAAVESRRHRLRCAIRVQCMCRWAGCVVGRRIRGNLTRTEAAQREPPDLGHST